MADDQPTVERWLPIVGYEGRYEVSDQGRVRSVDRIINDSIGRSYAVAGKPLRPYKMSSGHHIVTVDQTGGALVRKLVHVLVLESFIGPCPAGMEACHWDDDPSNNRLANLRWDTRSANTHDRVRNGVHPMSRKTDCKRGHPFTPENTRLERNGSTRRCIQCERDRQRRRSKNSREMRQ